MGMYDTIYVDVLGDHDYQTKNLDCNLDYYKIDRRDNKLYFKPGVMGMLRSPDWASVIEPVPEGVLWFHGFREGRFEEYRAYFDNSNECYLIEILIEADNTWKKVWGKIRPCYHPKGT